MSVNSNDPNVVLLEIVATHLGDDLLEQMIFVGGAVAGLLITDPLAFETQVSQWPGVVTVGVFAYQRAQVCLLGTAQGVKTMTF